MDVKDFFAYLEKTEGRILEFIAASEVNRYLQPDDVRESVLSYIYRPAKRLRPAVLLLACGCVGGEEREAAAIPAAAAVELFHTWSLVHDDLIDNDSMRRGEPTVHEAMAAKAKETFGLSDALAREYGRDIAVLAGDMQNGWSLTAFIDCGLQMTVDPVLILQLVKYLQSYVMGNLIQGEVMDIQYGMRKMTKMSDIGEDDIVRMLWLKTGVLYEFAALAGALIGKNSADFEDPQVKAIKSFSSNCGTAFQLQDDILGVLGDEKALGKPVGSDIREGKMTVIVHESLKNATPAERKTILSVLGNRNASSEQIRDTAALFEKLGGIGRCNELARIHIEKALPYLDIVEDSRYKQLLLLWADFMINREF